MRGRSENITYFRNNRHRMSYADARSSKYPIGSGVVEAACKSLVAQRLKCSGMLWLQHGGQAILSFRALVKSCQFEQAWEIVQKNYVKPVKPYNNVVNFPVH